MSDNKSRWDTTYSTKGEAAVSWYQPGQMLSTELIKAAAPSISSSIIDVGGGTSRLVDDLLAAGYSDLSVLDISEVALLKTKERLGSASDKLAWIVSDITNWQPAREWDVWHDRAVFHFLTEEHSQDAYLSAMGKATKSGSIVIMSTFSLSGPEKCSGLPVQRYSAESLGRRLGTDFKIRTSQQERHPTPFGTYQDFVYVSFVKT